MAAQEKENGQNLRNLEYVVASLPGYVYWKDIQSIYMGCNNNFSSFVGLDSNSDIVGKTDDDIAWGQKEIADKFIKDDRMVIDTRQAHTFEYEISIKRQDRNNIFFRADKKPLYDDEGNVIGTLTVFVDITDQKISERATHIEQTFIGDILYDLPGLIYWKNTKSQYVGFNKNVVTLSGVSREELRGKTDQELNWGKKEAEEFQEDDREVMKTGHVKVTEHEIPIKRSDGNFMIVRTEKSRLLDKDGNIAGILGVALDITEEKILEAKLGKEKEKIQAMESLAATVAHELRTPLRTVSASAVGIKKYFPDLLDGYRIAQENKLNVHYIDPGHLKSIPIACDTIIGEVDSSFTFIDMLLMNVKEHNAAFWELEEHSISECVNEALERYPFDSGERGLVHWDEDRDFIFKGDKILIIHVLFNLLKNAIYYIRDANKGAIHIWVEQISDRNVLHFKDTGKGVPADILPLIFNRFYTRTTFGAGVGLSYCQMVMEGLGGRIACSSKEGEYTEFTLQFPLHDAEIEPAHRNVEED